jgi:acyl-CoA thioesterase I
MEHRSAHVVKLYTFGDSILDCGHYNELGLTPGQLLVKNDDARFPEFRGRDLASRGEAALVHRAVDGSTVTNLLSQLAGIRPDGPSAAVLTVGGNDVIVNLGNPRGLDAFEERLDAFVRALPVRPVFLGNVYDPSLGDDANNFTGLPPAEVRAMHRRVNAAIAAVAQRHGQLVDLHAHFLTGDPSWFTHTIEPSLRGASEVRRCFLPFIFQAFHLASSYTMPQFRNEHKGGVGHVGETVSGLGPRASSRVLAQGGSRRAT